ncbi:hypothetical protein LTS18_006118 [Coniosporium uncinatum]|uniref:Uncharacterized protein n=1 Tax=Coniosporium uncinatum TaxID=93489 RepID=A0ACC3DQD5_9PEZI|nr:hypothetical protein LTS18_006118 [Coniosporium uncinatum]
MRFTKITTALCALFSGVLVRADFFERFYCHCANKDLVAMAFTFMLISNRLKESFHWAETCENKRQYEWHPHLYTCHDEIKAENCVGMPDPLDYSCGRAMGNYKQDQLDASRCEEKQNAKGCELADLVD